MLTGATLHSSAVATRRAYSTTCSLTTGSVPGCPAQMGQTAVFGAALVESITGQAQNIFDLVSISTWTSSPMTGSYSIGLFPYDRGDPLGRPYNLHEFCRSFFQESCHTFRVFRAVTGDFLELAFI